MGMGYCSVPGGPFLCRMQRVCLSRWWDLGLSRRVLRGEVGISLDRDSVEGLTVAGACWATSEVVRVGLLLPFRVHEPDVGYIESYWGEVCPPAGGLICGRCRWCT